MQSALHVNLCNPYKTCKVDTITMSDDEIMVERGEKHAHDYSVGQQVVTTQTKTTCSWNHVLITRPYFLSRSWMTRNDKLRNINFVLSLMRRYLWGFLSELKQTNDVKGLTLKIQVLLDLLIREKQPVKMGEKMLE